MRILNLYSGIGGNRKFWTPKGSEHEITAVESDVKIAEIYKDFFPNDTVVISDAHNFLLEHYKEFDFVWSSPPCPSHSHIRKELGVGSGQNEPVYPDMKLYEEILFLQGYFKGKYVVENVVSWYNPLIKPQKINKHYFWANFEISEMPIRGRCHLGTIAELQQRKGFDLTPYKGIDKRKLLRNCVEPETGEHIIGQIDKLD